MTSDDDNGKNGKKVIQFPEIGSERGEAKSARRPVPDLSFIDEIDPDEAKQFIAQLTEKGADVQKTAPEMGADVQKTAPAMGADVQKNAPEMGADVQKTAPEMGADVQKATPEMGADVQKPAPEMGADVQKTVPEMGADVQKPAPAMGADVQKTAPEMEADVQKTAPEKGADVQKTAPEMGADVQKTAPEMGADVQKTAPEMGADVQKTAPEMGADVPNSGSGRVDLTPENEEAGARLYDSMERIPADSIPENQGADVSKIENGRIPPKEHNVPFGGTIRIPNGGQNKPYRLDLTSLRELAHFTSFHIIDDDKTDLMIAHFRDHHLTGTPKEAGDFSIKIQAKHENNDAKTFQLDILINPDPKTLWKEIEPPENAPFAKPHRAYLAWQDKDAHGNDMAMFAARVRGRSHAQRGAFCEDDFAVVKLSQGYFGLVADGAGSSRFSRRASQLIAEDFPKHLQNAIASVDAPTWGKIYAQFDDTGSNQRTGCENLRNIFANAISNTYLSLYQCARTGTQDENGKPVEISLRDLYSTCLAFWALPLSTGQTAVVSYWVGDGGLAIQYRQRFKLLGNPDNGEFAGQTRFFTKEEISEKALKKRLQVDIYPDLQSIWAFSDGITDPQFVSEQQLNCSKRWHALTEEIKPHLGSQETLCDWLGFWSAGDHDDRSLCVLLRNHKELA